MTDMIGMQWGLHDKQSFGSTDKYIHKSVQPLGFNTDTETIKSVWYKYLKHAKLFFMTQPIPSWNCLQMQVWYLSYDDTQNVSPVYQIGAAEYFISSDFSY